MTDQSSANLWRIANWVRYALIGLGAGIVAAGVAWLVFG